MVNSSIIITDDFLKRKWKITASYTNNKTDKYVITSLDLAKFINKRRRSVKKIDRKNLPKAIYPMDSWLFDFILEKCREYITYFNMEDAEVMQIGIETID